MAVPTSPPEPVTRIRIAKVYKARQARRILAAVKKALLNVGDKLLGVPLMLLFVWPTRWKRKIAGPRDRGPRFWRGFAGILFVVCFYLLVIEGAFRIGQLLRGHDPSPPWRYLDDRFLYEFHPMRAFGLRPGADVVWGTAGLYWRKDLEIHVNRFGCRGPELAPKESGKPRVLCFGGSVTFGDKLNWDETWPGQLAEMSGWSVMNCGVPGYLSPHVLAFAQGGLLDLQPDLVIVYTGFNDLANNDALHPDRFRDDYRHANGLRKEPEGLAKWLVRNSFVYYGLSRWRRSATSAIGRIMNREVIPERVGPRGLAAYVRNYTDLAALCKRRGIPILFASESPGPSDAKWREWRRNGLGAYADALKSIGEPYVDTFRELGSDPALYSDFVHLAPKGCGRAAELVWARARKLLEK